MMLRALVLTLSLGVAMQAAAGSPPEPQIVRPSTAQRPAGPLVLTITDSAKTAAPTVKRHRASSRRSRTYRPR